MKLIINIFFVIACLNATSQNRISPPVWENLNQEEIDLSKATHLIYESDYENLFYYRNFIVNYDEDKRRPNWTIHRLAFNQLVNNSMPKIVRTGINFKFFPDKYRITDDFNLVKHGEYTNSGWDRGHLTPAGDFPYDTTLMNETFVTTNITPQSVGFNQGLWVKLESAIRYKIRNDTIPESIVITGVLYDNSVFRKIKNHQNKNRGFLYVPSHLYKILYYNFENEHYLYCFLIPHNLIYSNSDLETYQVTLDEIEKKSNINFFDKLDDNIENEIESIISKFE
jgi:endonuclease G